MKILYSLRKFTIPSYRIKSIGLGRVCEFIRRIAAKFAPQVPLKIENFWGVSTFNCYVREHMGSQIFFRGSYSEDQLILLESLLNEDSIFIDVGANQGEFSIMAASIAKNGKVISFEPVSEYRQRLLANITLNGFHNVQALPYALGEFADDSKIYDQHESFSDGTRHEGLPTLFASGSRVNFVELVPVRRLDDLIDELDIDNIDVIKLDIEGSEWIALRGAAITLARYKPILILEIGRELCRSAGYEPEELAQWIVNQGYSIRRIMGGGKSIPFSPNELEDFQNIIAYPVDCD
jgi:FkbM family methyltransferase